MISPADPFPSPVPTTTPPHTAHTTQGTTRLAPRVLCRAGYRRAAPQVQREEVSEGVDGGAGARLAHRHFNHQMSGTAQYQDPGKGMVEEGKKKRRKEKEVGGAKSAAAAAAVLLQSSDLLIAEFDALNSDTEMSPRGRVKTPPSDPCTGGSGRLKGERARKKAK